MRIRRGPLAVVNSAAALNVALSAGLGVATARFLGPSGQGALTTITTLVAIVVLICAVGTGASLRLRGGTGLPLRDIEAYFSLTILLVVLAGGFTALGLVVIWPGIVAGRDLVLTGLLGGASLLARQTADYVQARGRTAFSILSVGAGVTLQIGSFILLSHGGPASLSDALTAAILGSCGQVAAGLAMVGGLPLHRLAIHIHVWRALVSMGSPTLGYSLGLLAAQRLDRLLLVALVGTRAAGLYAVAATVAEAARFACASAGQLLFVRVSGTRTLTLETKRIYFTVMLVHVALIVSLAVFAPVVVPFMFGFEYTHSVTLLRGLLIAEFFMGAALLDSRIIMGAGRFKEVALITLGAVAVAGVAYPLLIRQSGAQGAVFGSILVYCIYAVTLFMRVRRVPRQSS